MLEALGENITRIILDTGLNIATDFNVASEKRRMKAQMLGTLSPIGVSTYQFNMLNSLFSNSDKVILLYYNDGGVLKLNFEYIIQYLTTVEQFKKLLFHRVLIGNEKYENWRYNIQHILNMTTINVDIEGFWDCSIDSFGDQSLLIVFAIAWTHFFDMDGKDASTRMHLLTGEAERLSLGSFKASALADISKFRWKDYIESTTLGICSVPSLITSTYKSIETILQGDIKSIANMLLELEVNSNFRILPMRINTYSTPDSYKILLLFKDIDILDYLITYINRNNLIVLKGEDE